MPNAIDTLRHATVMRIAAVGRTTETVAEARALADVEALLQAAEQACLDLEDLHETLFIYSERPPTSTALRSSASFAKEKSQAIAAAVRKVKGEPDA